MTRRHGYGGQRLVRSSAFRLALGYVALFAVSAVILLAFVYWLTTTYMQRQADETIEAEIEGLAERYRIGGLPGLTASIRARLDRTPQGSSIYLLTDAEIQERVNVGKGRLAGLTKVPDDRKVVEELYLASLSRFPTTRELEESIRYRQECESREVWMEDLLWSLVNVREFIFNH